MTIGARFDNAQDGSALVFDRPARTLVARHRSQVAAVTGAVERAWHLDSTPDEHAATVRHVQDLITAGSVYQVNVTTRARATVRGDLTALYGDLVHAQGAAHNALLHIDGRSSIISISPELFLDRAPPLVRCRPMKGTARRTEDDSSRRTLLTSAKDAAENVMIVDLVRNDLSRIAQPGRCG